MKKEYSVLMAVYAKENPDFLYQAIESMLHQTAVTNDFVLVCDGPLTDELNQVIADAQRENGTIFHVVRLEKNCGLGHALNIGVKACKNELVARMDSDDIARRERCELQLAVFERDIDLCSGYVAEFMENVGEIVSVKKLPLLHEEIVRFSKTRNPMNHMAVMFRKSAVLAAGNYRSVNCFEDYDLWVRMLHCNFKACNIDKNLVYARCGTDMYRRRGGVQYVKNGLGLQKQFLKMAYISRRQYACNCIIRILVGLAPVWVRRCIYKKGIRAVTK